MRLSWSVDEPPKLLFAWMEEGGPPVTPPKRRGFGSPLVGRLAEVDLHGRADLTYEPDGLRCTIQAPLAG